jgi:catechol 2,3-dioxygenase-like lactoylglutathione lyase family enzyme
MPRIRTAAMLTRIDHVMICVPDLAKGIDAYTRIGFDTRRGGAHPGRGTENAVAFNAEDYLELLAVRDRAEYQAASPDGGLLDFLAAGGGFRYVGVQSDDLAADVAAMRRRGVDVSDVADGERRTPAGATLRWKSARLGAGSPLPIFFVQHLTSLGERRAGFGPHPNGAQRVDRVYIGVNDVATAAALYGKVLGVPVPKIQRGAVIKADMAVFDLGPTGLTVAQPMEPGPAAEAMARRGPGPFQALYRTTSMDAAARWMADACGAYIGFVGPA